MFSNKKTFNTSMHPLWRYNKLDKTTHKYLDHIRRTKGAEIYAIWVKNPDFAYEHLSPYSYYDMNLDDYIKEKERRYGIRDNI